MSLPPPSSPIHIQSRSPLTISLPLVRGGSTPTAHHAACCRILVRGTIYRGLLKVMRQCAIGQASLAPMSSSDVMESSPRHLPHPARYRDLPPRSAHTGFKSLPCPKLFKYHVRVHYPLWIRDA
ncbi:hypothetical protein CCM_09402 [Cordyceps militaris CM01]|uniref:Uncharacterized protein n=1 Tax=Cordyceps militaris (strain CM01) TaxID=983644 RepID=G3JU73_CORMM|nr:uncharacterized protein CCM_09402 [Cordyceps militaris CM01]EGX87780.1 hypothetical protein CCM_09402 [Cordyceps militaris CM01]